MVWGEDIDPNPEVQRQQSLAAVNQQEKVQMNQKGGIASGVQTQVLNIANVEPKGKSINQNKSIVQSVQSLVQQDLKLVDQERKEEKKENKQETPKHEEQKHEEPKAAEKPKVAHKDEAETWFAASLNKFRNLKKKMFSALSFLPQTGEMDLPPEDYQNIMLTNQQKLGLFDTIVNEEEPKQN